MLFQIISMKTQGTRTDETDLLQLVQNLFEELSKPSTKTTATGQSASIMSTFLDNHCLNI